MDKKLQQQLSTDIQTIFEGCELSSMSQYEKRQAIFSHLSNTMSYNFGLLETIHNIEVNKARIKRDPVEELNSAVFDHLGICNSITQYYKLLLEQVGVKAYCVVCDDGTPVNHQLALVKDDEHDTYSFDDVTRVVVKLGNEKENFDYDVNEAHLKGQGNKKVLGEEEFFVLSEEYVNYLVRRDNSLCDSLQTLPTNIKPVQTFLNEQAQQQA